MVNRREFGFYSFGTQGIIRYFATPGTFTNWTEINIPVSITMDEIREENGKIVLVAGDGLIMATGLGDIEYQAWLATNFPGESDPLILGQEQDPDEDGAANFEEYARSTDPNSPTPPLVVAYDRSSFGPRIQWTHTTPPVGVEVSAEFSFDLDVWLTTGVLLNTTQGVTDTSYEAEVTGTPGNSDELFLRLRWSPEN